MMKPKQGEKRSGNDSKELIMCISILNSIKLLNYDLFLFSLSLKLIKAGICFSPFSTLDI